MISVSTKIRLLCETSNRLIKSLWIAWTNVKHFPSNRPFISLGRGEYIALRIPPFYIQSCTVWKEIKFGRLGKKWVSLSARINLSRVAWNVLSPKNFPRFSPPPLNATWKRVGECRLYPPRSRLSHPIYGSRNRTCAISGARCYSRINKFLQFSLFDPIKFPIHIEMLFKKCIQPLGLISLSSLFALSRNG